MLLYITTYRRETERIVFWEERDRVNLFEIRWETERVFLESAAEWICFEIPARDRTSFFYNRRPNESVWDSGERPNGFVLKISDQVDLIEIRWENEQIYLLVCLRISDRMLRLFVRIGERDRTDLFPAATKKVKYIFFLDGMAAFFLCTTGIVQCVRCGV